MNPPVFIGTVLTDLKDDVLFINRQDYNYSFNFFDSIQQLTYPNYSFYCVDNSKNPNYHNNIQTKGIDCDYFDPKELTAREILAECYKMIRQKFLETKAEYLLTVECDIELIPDTIERLLSHDKEVVGFPYIIRKGREFMVLIQVLDNFSKGLRFPMTLSKVSQMKFMDGTVKPVYNIGNGCLLIKREIVEQLEFRVSKEDIGFQDEFFSRDFMKMDMNMNKYVWVDTSVTLKHYFRGVWEMVDNNRHILKRA